MANGGQYVTHTGLTVMPASYADSLDWGKVISNDNEHVRTMVKIMGVN